MNTKRWKYSGKPVLTGEHFLVETADGNWNIALVQGEMDARLIAAAPELLEALIAYNEAVNGRVVGPHFDKAIKLANAALAKVEGKE